MEFVKVNAAGDAVELDRTSHRPTTLVEHPVEVIQRTNRELMEKLEMSTYRNVFGAHYPAILRMQEAALKDVGRAPGLPSSRIGLEIMRGDDESIDYCDVLGADDSSMPLADMHLAMERKLGIQIRSDW